jgi:hypothetical protein
VSRVIFEAKTSGEIRIETFDFTSRLTSAETISTASVSAIVYSGTDASPSSLIYGAATISGKTVTQKLGGGVEGVVYNLTAVITTSTGQQLELNAFLAIVPRTS